MGLEKGCPCCKVYKDGLQFKKVMQLKGTGLVIYRHTTPLNSVASVSQPEKAYNINDNVFIIHNTKSSNVSTSNYMSEFEQAMNCPRCRYIVKYTKQLLLNVPFIRKKDVIGICDHCRFKKHNMNERCNKCQLVVEDFLKRQDQQQTERRDSNKKEKVLTSKIQHILKDAPKAVYRKSKTQLRSETSLKKSLSYKTSPTYHEPRVKDMFEIKMETDKNKQHLESKQKGFLGQIEIPKLYMNKSDSEITFTEADRRDKHHEPKKNILFKSAENIAWPESLNESAEFIDLNKKRQHRLGQKLKQKIELDLERLTSTELEEYLKKENDIVSPINYGTQRWPSEKSDIHEKKDINKRKKEQHSYDDIDHAKYEEEVSKSAQNEEDIFLRDIQKQSRSVHNIRRYSSEETLLRSASAMTEPKLHKDFSYCFIKETDNDKKPPRKHASSSELIKDTQDKYRARAEEERIKKEQELKEKLEAEEQKRLAKIERMRYQEEKRRLEELKRKKAEEERRLEDLKKKKAQEEQDSSKKNHTKQEVESPKRSVRASKEPSEKSKSSKLKTESKESKIDKSLKSERDSLKSKKEITKQDKEELMRLEKERKLKEKSEKEEQMRKTKEEKLKEKEERDKEKANKAEQMRKTNEEEQIRKAKEEKDKEKEEKDNEKANKEEQMRKTNEEEQMRKTKEEKQKEKEERDKEKANKAEQMRKTNEEEQMRKTNEEEQMRKTKEKKQKEKEERDKEKANKAEQMRKTNEEEQIRKAKEEKDKEKKEKDNEKANKEEQKRKAKEEKDKEKEEKAKEKANKEEQMRKAKEEKQKEKEEREKQEEQLRIDKEQQQREKEEKLRAKEGRQKEKELARLQAEENEKAREKKEEILKNKQLKQQLIDLQKEKDKESKLKKKQEDEAKKKEAQLKLKSLRETKAEELPEEPQDKKNTEESKIKDLNINEIKIKKDMPDDLILKLVKLKQTRGGLKERPTRMSQINIPNKTLYDHRGHKNNKKDNCIICLDSDLELDIENIRMNETKTEEINDIIIGQKIFKYKHSLVPKKEDKETKPLLFNSTYTEGEDNIVTTQERGKEMGKKAPNLSAKNVEQEVPKGITRYALSDRTFIEKGWTMLPTEKVVRKMNVYRMRPAHPEFDWFEHNKSRKLICYDTGEKLAEFDDNGRGRWFYKSGKVALDYYDTEETNALHRIVIFSSGEPDDRGCSRPFAILATFDYLGNGIVFDHSGKIRLKYNQTEGVVLDRSIGPVSHWKWHTLNDPPVLQQVMIDTQMAHKDPEILKLGGPHDDKPRPDNEEMLAIEFDNFIKEKSKKLTQKFKPFQIKMKALKINEYFSLKVLDQATIYLIYRDGSTNLKLNIGMILDHQEIVDTDIAEVGEVSNSLERFPARTDSLAGLQRSVAHAQRVERARVKRTQRLRPAQPCASADRLVAGLARPPRPPPPGHGSCQCRKPPSFKLYYDTSLI